MIKDKVALVLPNGEKRNYGPFKCGNLYHILYSGPDYYALTLAGKRVLIDKPAVQLYDLDNFESRNLQLMKKELDSWNKLQDTKDDDYEEEV